MGNLKNVFTIASKVVAVIFLTAGNVWAVASFAKKYGMGCKSCHSFGSELNNLGLTFKKNGNTFGEKSAGPKEKSKQGEPQDNKDTVSDSSAVAEPLDAEQTLPETKVYRWKSGDGTLHFSDTLYVNPQSERKSVSEKVTKKSSRAGFRPLSAKVPERLQRATTKTAAPAPEKKVLSNHELSGPLETSNIEIMPVVQPKNYEKCMEKIFITYPSPKTPDAAMEQFREAEGICVPYEKNQKR